MLMIVFSFFSFLVELCELCSEVVAGNDKPSIALFIEKYVERITK